MDKYSILLVFKTIQKELHEIYPTLVFCNKKEHWATSYVYKRYDFVEYVNKVRISGIVVRR